MIGQQVWDFSGQGALVTVAASAVGLATASAFAQWSARRKRGDGGLVAASSSSVWPAASPS